jgi:hypothetical protein
MTPEHFTQLGSAVAFLLIGGVAAWKAAKAERQTRGTGNGFAQHVRESLSRIEDHGDRIDSRLERLERRFEQHLEHHTPGGARLRRFGEEAS